MQQSVHIRMHSPHVAANTLRRLEQGDWPGAGQRLHERHAVGREHLSKQVERLERGTFLLPLARKGFPQPLPEGFGRINSLIWNSLPGTRYSHSIVAGGLLLTS